MKLLPSSLSGKIGLSLIMAFLAVSVALVSGANGSISPDGLLVKLFLVFLSAIIAMQVVPGVLLFGAMIKGLSCLVRKESVKEIQK